MRTIEQNKEMLDPVYQEFLDSGFLPESTLLIGEIYNLNESDRVVLWNGLDLLFYLVLTKTETVDFLANEIKLSREKITAAIDDIFLRLPDGLEDSIELCTLYLREAEGPGEMEKINPMRTMSSDIEKVHGYGAQQQAEEDETVISSSQSDVLSTTPDYNTEDEQPPEQTEPTDEAKRWDSQ